MSITDVKTRTRCRKVKDLFISGSRQWNEDKIREIFFPHDADEIIKLEPMKIDEDLPAWHYESTGIFSVKSAYKLAFDIQRSSRFNSGNSRTGDDSRDIWNLIWRCKVPNKIRIFAWRCASDNLSTKKNKWRRTLEEDSTCSICGTDEESSYHATVACTKARALRFKMREVWSLPGEEEFKFTGPDWLLILLANSSKDSHPLILLLLWRAWHHRNNIVHEDGQCSIDASAVFLQNYVYTLTCSGYSLSSKRPSLQASKTTNTDATSHGNYSPIWSPPKQGSLKLNFDASFIQDTNQGFMGGVIRDHKAGVICAMAEKLTSYADAQEAEAKALLKCLQNCVVQGIHPSEVETDCAAVYTAVNAANQDISKLCFIYREIDNIRKSVFSFSMSLVKRDCNTVAHELAKCNRMEGTQGIWNMCFPDQIKPLIGNDCNKLLHQ
jgi:ribonuclease HI